jgi:hypothetical protein
MTALHLQTPDARTRDLLLRLALALDCTELTDGPLSVACPCSETNTERNRRMTPEDLANEVMPPLVAELGADLYYHPREPLFSIDVVAPSGKPCLVLVLFRIRLQVGWLVVA